MLEVGSVAKDFTLVNELGENISLSQFKGKKVVLYFYPKDNTAGCSKQACGFKEHYYEIIARNAVVIGISKDSMKSHQNFKNKYDLPFYLLCDEDHQVCELYDVWKEKKMCGKTYMGIVRSTYIIDEEGIIIKTYPKANTTSNALDVLTYLQSI